MSKFVNLHVHTDYSNATKIEIASKTEEYIDLAKEQKYPAMAITEHGNIFNWTIKKDLINDSNMKYIHGVEVYVTMDIREKLRDDYQLILLAKNYDGVQEINRLVSNSFIGKGNKESEDSHFYYVPQIDFRELVQTSDNIIILTSGLNSPLWKTFKANFTETYKKWLNYFLENKNRVWLEVQPHNNEEQKIYNKQLLKLSEEYGFKIVATNDIHAHTERANEVRKILIKGKRRDSSNSEPIPSDDFEVWWKDYDEMYEAFQNQGALSQEQIKQALSETLNICDMVEDFTFNRKPKYPRIFDNPIDEIQQHVLEGYSYRGIDKLPNNEQKIYQERVVKELKVMAKTDTVDYLLLEYTIKKAMREDGRYPGPGRGSSAGSLVAYLLRIVDVDPIKHDLLFERFMNEDRQKGSVADIDSDYGEEDRAWVQRYLLTHDILNCASIVTFGTLGVKNAFKDMGKGMGYEFFQLNQLTQQFENIDHKDVIPMSIQNDYPELCQVVSEVEGVVVNVGRHAAGVIVSDRDLVSEIGNVEVKDFKYQVSTIDMSGVEKLQYVKLDILGLKNVEWIQRTTELAGLGRMYPGSDYVNFDDWHVADEISKDNAAIFQFESDRTGKVVKEILSPTSLARIREFNPNISVVDLLSVATAVIRPGAASIVEDVMQGKPKDNGYKELNDVMRESMGYMVFQEEQMKFMTEFADMTGAESDNVRRAIGHKIPSVIKKEVPLIKEKFIKKMMDKYGDSYEKVEPIADEFMQIFLDSADYSFNKSHSVSYGYITYETAWLRTYYPLEYITAGLQLWKDNQEKSNRLINYAKSQGITIKPPKFRYSKGDYFFDRDNNAIYQGTAHIKGNNSSTGDMLFKFKDKKFNFFVDLLLQLRDEEYIIATDDNLENKMSLLNVFNLSEEEVKALDKNIKKDEKDGGNKYKIIKNSYPINKTKLLSLIRLNFFSEFGSSKKLEKIFTQFDKTYNAKNKTFTGKHKKYWNLIELEKSTPNDEFSLFERCEFDLFYTGQVTTVDKKIPTKYAFVVKIDKVGKTRTSAVVYSINKGINIPIKVGSKVYRNNPFKEGDLLAIENSEAKPKITKVDGEWIKHPTDKELWIKELTTIRKGTFDGK